MGEDNKFPTSGEDTCGVLCSFSCPSLPWDFGPTTWIMSLLDPGHQHLLFSRGIVVSSDHVFILQVCRVASWLTDMSVEHGETLLYTDCLLYASLFSRILILHCQLPWLLSDSV